MHYYCPNKHVMFQYRFQNQQTLKLDFYLTLDNVAHFTCTACGNSLVAQSALHSRSESQGRLVVYRFALISLLI